MPDHRFAVSAEVHEPKHITNSTTADTGKVITASASSSGTSEFRLLSSNDLSDIDTLIPAISYGEVEVDANASSFAVTAATDPLLDTVGDYVLLNSSRITAVAGDLFDQTFQAVDNAVVLNRAGVYRVSGWVNCKSDTISSKIGIRYSLNGVPVKGILKTDIKDADRVENLSGNGFTTLAEGDVVGMAIACDKAASLTITDLRLTLELIREL